MSDDSYEGATAGRVLEFGSNESVKFPAAFKDAMGTERGLMVLVHKDQFL